MSEPPERARNQTTDSPTYVERPRARNGAGVAALVLGIVALILSLLVLLAPIGFLLGIVAVIVGIVGISRVSKGEAENRGQAITGLITGALAILLAVLLGIGLISLFANNSGDLRRLATCLGDSGNDTERAACLRELEDRLDEEN